MIARNLPGLCIAVIGLALFSVAPGPARAAADYDVIIRNGTLIDGSGSARRAADVAIKGDRIALVGVIPPTATATRTVNAKGRIVAPGFIDPHSHAAPGIETPGLAAAKPILLQGITTVFINPDGGGAGDLAPQLARIRSVRPGVNVLPLIGHNGVRQAVMGLANRHPTAAEQARMEALVKAAMDSGVPGLSSGPFYVPGKYSDTAEMIGLARVVARYPHGFHTSHIRDESNYDLGVIGAIEELIAVSRAAKLTGVVSHMKMLGPSVWGKSAEAIALIDKARAEGLSIWADQYPYAASGSGLQPALVPGWAQEGGRAALAERLKNPELRARIRAEMAINLQRRAGANAILIGSYAPDRALEGKRLDEIARARGMDPLEVAIAMLEKADAGIISFNMSENDIEALMKQPWMMTSTDGALVKFGTGSEHPRAYGAFPRKLRRYALDRHVISLEAAIHSSSGLPAQVFAIPDRGVIRPGAFADIIVFDPATVTDTATYTRPHSYATGIDNVFVNGTAAVVGGRIAPTRGGRILLRTR